MDNYGYCQIKDENPGVDLLFATNWDAEIEEFLLDNPEPAAMPSPALMQSSSPDEPAPGPVSPAPDADEKDQGVSPLTTVGVAVAAALVAVVIGSIILSRKKEGNDS